MASKTEDPPAAQQAAQTSVVPQKRQNGVLMLLAKYKTQIERVIPRQYLTPERMMQLVVNALNKSPELLNCSPVTVVNAVVHIAQLGLEIRPGEAYLAPMGKECVPMIDYRGKVKVARRSGFLRDVIADVVYSNDAFTYSVSDKEGRKLAHTPLYARPTAATPGAPMLPISKEARGEPIAAYVLAWLKDEERPHIEVMPKYQIEEIRAMSKQSHGLMWEKSWDEGAKKTVVHRAMKLLAHDDATMKAQELDDAMDAGISLDNIIDITPEDASEAEKASAGGSAAVATDGKTAELSKRLAAKKRGGQTTESEQPQHTSHSQPDAGGATGGPAVPSGPSNVGAQGEGGSRGEAPGQVPTPPSSPKEEAQIREVKELPDPAVAKEGDRCIYRSHVCEFRYGGWKRVLSAAPPVEEEMPAFDFGGRS